MRGIGVRRRASTGTWESVSLWLPDQRTWLLFTIRREEGRQLSLFYLLYKYIYTSSSFKQSTTRLQRKRRRVSRLFDWFDFFRAQTEKYSSRTKQKRNPSAPILRPLLPSGNGNLIWSICRWVGIESSANDGDWWILSISPTSAIFTPIINCSPFDTKYRFVGWV